MDNFAYDAPYFVDFSRDLGNEDAQKVEAFFEVEHEKHDGQQAVPAAPIDVICIDDSGRDIEQEFYTPLKVTPESRPAEQFERGPLRKSVSMGHLLLEAESVSHDDEVELISETLQDLKLPGNTKFTKPLNTDQRQRIRKSHLMTTRADAPKLDLRSRSISRDHLDKLAQPKRKHISLEDLHGTKYVSMAEAVTKFHSKTPQRFHSKSKTDLNTTTRLYGPIPNTVPMSPALATKQRARPVNVISSEEQEMKDYEAAQQFKIKAHPANLRILKGPVQLKAPSISKKPSTVPEPFRLTEVHTKKAPPSPKPASFHANPVPKSVLQPPKPIIKSQLHTTAHTPRLMKRYARVELGKHEAAVENGVGKVGQQPVKLERTKPVPFSFEERDKEVSKKREKLINEVLEEERKAREFHAKPIPKSIFKSPQPKSNSSIIYQKRQRSDTSIYTSTESVSSEPITFKARPAKVLQMKPFEPKKDETHLIEISEFQLNSARRATERQEYEQKLKEREEKIAQYIKESSEKMLQSEKQEVARLRKQMEHQAKPIRRYKEVKPVPSKKLTSPVAPKFMAGNKENSNLL